MDWSATDARVLLDAVEDTIAVLDPRFNLLFLNAAGRLALGLDGGADGHVGADVLRAFQPAEVIHPDDLPEIFEAFSRVLADPSHKVVTRMRVPSSGIVPEAWRTVEVTATNHVDEPGIGGVVVCFREVHKEEAAVIALSAERRLRADVVALRAQVEERQTFLDRIVVIQGLIARRAPLNDVLQSVVDTTAEVVSCASAALRLVDQHHPDRLVLTAWTGLSDIAPVLAIEPPVEAAFIGEEHPVMCDLDVEAPSTVALHGAWVTAGLVAPIRLDGRVVGTLTVVSNEPGRTFSDSSRQMLESLTEHAALALMDARSQEQMLRQALIDPLTGLPNRALLLDRIERSLSRSRRTGVSTAVLFVDLDRFKAINDSSGHDAGDKVLIEVARRAEAVLQAGDTLARLGGDEFVAVLSDADELVAAAIAQRIGASLRRPIAVDGQVFFIDCSIGVSLSNPNGSTAQTMVGEADIAMYRSKANGGAGVQFFEASMKSAVVQRASLEGELRAAIAAGEIDVFFQPVMSFHDLGVYAVEALARWTSSERGSVPPSEFIPLAESAGLVTDLDRLILRRSCSLIRDVVDPATGTPVILKVNLSPRHLAAIDVVDAVWSALVDTDFPPERLVLELTETELMQDTSRTIVTLEQLRDLGLKVAVDDFGTGYSSLAYLQQFPIDIMKIDRSFVTDAVNDERCLRLTQAMIDVARALHLDVVAEGIETVEHARLLRTLGADYGQGYLFARPAPIGQLAATFELARLRARQALSYETNDDEELLEEMEEIVASIV